jgi:predicted nucleic acid-binding protein
LTIYFDTGILLKLYSAEADSAKAIALVQRFGSPICFTDLQDAELRNALYGKNARNEISRPELRKALRDLQSDIDQAILQPPSIEWTEVFAEAINLQVCFFYSMPDSRYSARRFGAKPRSYLDRFDQRASTAFSTQGRS